MKAAVLYKANEPLPRWSMLEQEGPRAGEARVKVKAAGICHSDWHIMNGDWPLPLPMVLGHEAAGIVDEVGAGVANVKPGDHIIFSFRPHCGRCFYCWIGRTILCDGYSSPRWGLLDGSFRMRRNGEDLRRWRASGHSRNPWSAPGRDAGAHPQGHALAAGGPHGLLRAHGRGRGDELRQVEAGRPCWWWAVVGWGSRGPGRPLGRRRDDRRRPPRQQARLCQGVRGHPHPQRLPRQRRGGGAEADGWARGRLRLRRHRWRGHHAPDRGCRPPRRDRGHRRHGCHDVRAPITPS